MPDEAAAKEKRLPQIFDLEGRVAIITGASGLLGGKHAEAIAELGGIPVLIDIEQGVAVDRAAQLATRFGCKAKALRCDVTSETDIALAREHIIREFGRIDILINNAAINPTMLVPSAQTAPDRLENLALEDWDREIAVGLTGAFLCSRIFGPVMAASGNGCVINVASDLALIAPDQRLYRRAENEKEGEQPVKPITYSVVKAGLIGLTRYLSTYWPGRLRANALAPGGVYNTQDPEFVHRLTNLIPMGRMAHQDEYKGAIAFLASDASAYMNGAILCIDGGRTAW
jgi:NAD(P)-dependent dehydrogenase (short-subunit alcohol dehydrogenase family)